MNFWNKIDQALNPDKNGVNNFFRGVPNNVQKPINDAVNRIKQQLEQIGNEIESEINQGKNTIYNEMKNRQGELVANVTRVGQQIEDGVKKVGGEIESVGKKAIGEIEGAGKKVVGEVESVGKKVVDQIDDEVEAVIKKIGDGFKRKAVKEALTAAKDIASEIPVSDITVTISVISFSISNPAEKIKTIEKYIKSPPSGEDEVIAMLKDIGIGTVSVQLSGEFFSSAISAGVSFSVDLAESAEFITVIKKHVEKIVKFHHTEE